MPIMSVAESTFCRSAPWRAFARRVVTPWALAGQELSGDVLEIGAGSGAMAAAVAAAFPGARLTVTDIDEAMVRSTAARLGHLANVVAERADVTGLPFPAEAFDAVTSYLMLHHVVSWEPALAEACRVLRPGGRLLGYDLTDTSLARVVHRLDGSPHRLIRPEALRAALAAAGFEAIEVDLSAAGHLMRFAARKPAAPAPQP